MARASQDAFRSTVHSSSRAPLGTDAAPDGGSMLVRSHPFATRVDGCTSGAGRAPRFGSAASINQARYVNLASDCRRDLPPPDDDMTVDGSARAAQLPPLPRRYAERALPPNQPTPHQVRITQQGEMWQKPRGRAMRFTASQYIAVERLAFSWQAHFPVLGPLALRVVDEYTDAEGKLEVRLLGLPLQRQQGPETTAGEALRYLAELPFVPHAIVHNPHLQWRQLNERTAQVAAWIGAERLTVQLQFNKEGDIVGSSSEDRRRKVANEWIATPWGGRFGDYQTLGGIRLPTSGEAYWDLPAGRYVYWRGTVLSAALLDEPFRRAR